MYKEAVAQMLRREMEVHVTDDHAREIRLVYLRFRLGDVDIRATRSITQDERLHAKSFDIQNGYVNDAADSIIKTFLHRLKCELEGRADD